MFEGILHKNNNGKDYFVGDKVIKYTKYSKFEPKSENNGKL